jgi:gamma-glutamyltranspeptidase/glutathione hydrolase
MARRGLFTLAFAALLGCAEGAPVTAEAPASSIGTMPPPAGTTAPDTAAAALHAPASAPATPSRPPPPDPPIRLRTGGGVVGEAGAVTSVEANATRAGVAVLESGGNAIDAAVAVAFALAVTHPSAGNLGGGGFMMVRTADGRSTAIDFRETAPAASTTKKVLDEIAAGAIGWPSTAVPGTVAGLAWARENLGTRPLAELVAPAAKLARGHALSPRAAQSLSAQWDKLKKDPHARKIFGKGDRPLVAGDRLVQRDLAKTLETIGSEGPQVVYTGKIAEAIEVAMKKGGGDVTRADLAKYQVKERTPLAFPYRGFLVETMPPPSMGGVAVAQILLSLDRLRALGVAPSPGSAAWHHLFVETSKRAYAERRSVGADPDHYGETVPAGALEKLLSPEHLAAEWAPIDPARATPSSSIARPPAAGSAESPETTHISVVDALGNAVSCTVTLSASFGAKVIVPGTGILLSNALGAFSETGPNAVAPGKRMASSMSPTLLSRGGRGKALAVVGSPGGDTIPGIVAQLVRNLVDAELDVAAAGRAARIHHQWLPDEIRTEKPTPIPRAVADELRKMGHVVAESFIPLGDAKLIVIAEDGPRSWAFADDREGGLALGVAAVKAR